MALYLSIIIFCLIFGGLALALLTPDNSSDEKKCDYPQEAKGSWD